jgi:plasmid stabilization system protein ParE
MGSSARQARRPYEVIFTPLAQAELELAWAWYDERSERAAARFLDVMDHLVEQVGEAPRQFPVVRGDIRRALAGRRFPYALFFRIDDQRVVVIACFHLSRDPREWQRR